MPEIEVDEAKEHQVEVIRAARTGEPVYLASGGVRLLLSSILASSRNLRADAGGALDGAECALAREEGDHVPWDQVEAELGLR